MSEVRRWILALLAVRAWVGWTRFLCYFRGWHGMNGWHQQWLWYRFCYVIVNGTVSHDDVNDLMRGEGQYERAKAEGWLW